MASSRSQPGPALRALRERALRLELPLRVLWEITQRCDLQCRHCYLRGKWEEDELGTDEAKDLLRQMARLGVMFLAFTGGEPLARADFFELVDEASELGFAWKLFTAGTPVDDATARLIAQRGPLHVSVSLYGLEEAHDWMTSTPGSFAAALGAIERLVGLGVQVIVKVCLTPKGLEDLPALRTLCARLGARLYVATTVYPALDRTPADGELRLSDEELAGHLADGDRTPGPASVHEGIPAADDPICDAGRSSFAISPRGDVRACVFLRSLCGNVRETPLRAIWESEAMARARGLTFGARAGCRGCEDARFCFFCPGLAEAETGDALSPPPGACREARIRRRLWESHAKSADRRPGDGHPEYARCEGLGPD